MEHIELSITDDVFDAVKKLKRAASSEVNIEFPEGSVIFENALNLKLLKMEAQRSGKTVSFETEDEIGLNLIDSVEGIGKPTGFDSETGFTSQVKSIAQKPSEMYREPGVGIKEFKNPFKLSFLSGVSGRKKIFGLFLTIPIAAILGVLYFLFLVYPSANVKVVVNSESLVRSVTIKVSKEVTGTSTEKREIPGNIVSTTYKSSRSQATTGEKIVGDKAKGEVTIYNKTTSETKFKKGTSISLVSSKESLKFVLDEDVTIPAKTVTESTSTSSGTEITTSTETFGKKKVKVTAETFGSKYNLDDDKSFKVGSKDTDDFIAENDDKFSGGSSKTVSAVSQEDKNKLSASAFEDVKEEALTQLKADLDPSDRIVDSGVVYKKVSEVFDKNVGDEAETLSDEITITASAVAYEHAVLNSMVAELTKEFVPEGFELNEEDKSIEVGYLTSTTDAVTGGPGELNLQVKLKAYIIPKIDSEEIKKNLKGAPIKKGTDYLATIKNIESYSIDMWPKFALILGRFPSNEEKVVIEIIRK